MAEYWETTPLLDMTEEQWELLCDKCGVCCLYKVENEKTGELYITDVACLYLDIEKCLCKCYHDRKNMHVNCKIINKQTIQSICHWLPETCAYRLLFTNQPLPDWHPLLTHEYESVHRAGISIRGKVVSEKIVAPDEWPYHIIGPLI